MKGYAHIWSEDDTGMQDRECLADAFYRITRQPYRHWRDQTKVVDLGDAMTFDGGRWLTMEAYDGGHIYCRCACDQ